MTMSTRFWNLTDPELLRELEHTLNAGGDLTEIAREILNRAAEKLEKQ